MEDQKITLKELIETSTQKLEDLIHTLTTANIMLEGRVNNNKERFLELNKEIDKLKRKVEEIDRLVVRLDEKTFQIRTDISNFKNIINLLKIDSEIGKEKDKKDDKNWEKVASVIIAIIVALITLLIGEYFG